VDLDYLRAATAQWDPAWREAWERYIRSCGIGCILVATGGGIGLLWQGWTPLDAALLLWADMVLVLLCDALKYLLAPGAVRRALLHNEVEQQCWLRLQSLRARGAITRADVESLGRPGAIVRRRTVPRQAPPPGSGSLWLFGGLVLPAMVLLAVGVGLWFAGRAEAVAPANALADPFFRLWLGVSALWRIGDTLLLVRRARFGNAAAELVPEAGLNVAVLLVSQLLVTMVAFLLLFESQAGLFILLSVAGYLLGSLLAGALSLLLARTRRRWLAAFEALDLEGAFEAPGTPSLS
jgi:hypothetical protein